MALIGPSGPLFPPDTQILNYIAIAWGFSAVISCFWVVYALNNWRKTKYDWKSDHLYMAIGWIFFFIGYVLNIAASIQWMSCKYPYIYRVPSPVTSNCLVLVYLQVGSPFVIDAGLICMAIVLYRYGPVFKALAMNWVLILHKVSYFLFALSFICSIAIELAILFGLYDQDIYLDIRSDQFDRLHADFLRIESLIIGTIPSINSLLLIRYILGALKEIRLEIRQGKKLERNLRNRKYLMLTYLFISLQLSIILIVALISADQVPQYYSLSLMEQQLFDYQMTILFHMFNQLSTISFSNVLRENSANSVKSVISTRWVEYNSCTQSDGQSGTVSMLFPIQSKSSQV